MLKRTAATPPDAAKSCFALRINPSGKVRCNALNDIYCIKDGKGCGFMATEREAAKARRRAAARLKRLGKLEKYEKKYGALASYKPGGE